MTDVTTEEAKVIIAKHKNDSNFVILDVRSPEEFKKIGHLEKAINIDIESPNFQERIAELDTNKTYLVYCRSGGRSKAAQELMCQLGFKEVINVKGYLFGNYDRNSLK
ncbi:rhodanese-like domain-containing protein [Candidatus Woesearchaeota archaeon]|nr:rhodanese-like domain-containing protein [Candidatus Woesearchaeota archaeon]